MLISLGWAALSFLWSLWVIVIVQEGTSVNSKATKSLHDAAKVTLQGNELGEKLLASDSFVKVVETLSPSELPYYLNLLNYTPNQGASDGGEFWIFLPLLASFAFGYLITVGPFRFVADFFRIPSVLLGIVRREPRSALAHVLWGAGVAVMVTHSLSPMLRTGLFFTLLATLPGVLGQSVSRLIMRLAYDVFRWLSPNRAASEPGPAPIAIAAMGAMLATVLVRLLHPEQLISRGSLGMVLLGASAFLVFRSRHAGLVGAVIGLYLSLRTEGAWADDGGWQEALTRQQDKGVTWENIRIWWRSRGAQEAAAQAATAAVGSAGASGLGLGLGGAAGEGGMGWDQAGGEGGRVPYDDSHEQLLDDLWQEVDNDRFITQMERIFDDIERTGEVDLDELSRLQREWDAELRRRREEIDRDQERWSQEQRERRQERAQDEARAREAEAEQERERQRNIARGRALINRISDPVKAQELEDFLDRNSGDPESLERAVAAIRSQTYEAEQQRNIGESEAAQAEADAYAESQRRAETIRDNARRANRILARAVPGGDRIVAAQDALYGATEDYSRDGVRGVIQGAATNLIDDKTRGLGSAIRDAARDAPPGETPAQRAQRAASNWWHNATDDKNPLEIGRRLARAEGLGDVIDVGLDTADAADEVRGGDSGPEHPDTDSAPRSRPDSEPARRPADSEPARRPADSEPGRRPADSGPARRPADSEPGREQRRGPDAPAGEDSSGQRVMRDEDPAPPQEPRAPQTPPDRDRTEHEQRAERAQTAQNDAERRLGQAEMDRDIARERAVESRQELQAREREAAEARDRVSQTEAELEANRRELERARDQVRSEEPIPGAVDSYEAAQRQRAELESRLEGERAAAEQAEGSSQQAQDAHNQRAQELRERTEAQREAAQSRDEARDRTQRARDAVRQDRDPRFESAQAEHRAEQAQEGLERARRTVAEAEASGDPGKRRLAADALNRAQQEVADSQAARDQARQRLEAHQALEEQRREDADRAIRNAQVANNVEVEPLQNPGQHRELTPDQLRTERAHAEGHEHEVQRVVDPESGVEVAVDPRSAGQHPGAQADQENLPDFDGRNVRGQQEFDSDGNPVSSSINNEGTRIHERTHAHAHPSFRQEFPPSDSTRNLHEGLTEFFTQETLSNEMSPRLDERQPIYSQQRSAVENLANKVGRQTLANAYFNGDVDGLADKIGGRRNLQVYNNFLRLGDYDGAAQFLDSVTGGTDG